MNTVKINAVKTDAGVFINHSVNNHSSSVLETLFINGEKPKRAHVKKLITKQKEKKEQEL